MLSPFWDTSLIIAGWMIRVWALVYVPFKRPASESRAWLIFFFVLPIPSLLIYLVIGRPEHNSARKKLCRDLPDLLSRALRRGGADKPCEWKPQEETQISAVNLAEGLAHMPALDGNSVEMLPHYDEALTRLCQDIDGAQHHVHLEFYIFAADQTGDRIMSALERARARGVRCRVLIDALGSIHSSMKVRRRLNKAGVEVHRILPLVRRWRSSRIDLRNHRKIAVIDGRIGYTGSQNVVDAANKGRLPPNKELMIRVRGPIVSGLQAVFLSDWYLETETEVDSPDLFTAERHAGNSPLQLLPSGPDFPSGSIDLFFINALHDAQHEVVMATPYFIPNDALLAAIKTAAIRGVKVVLYVPRRTDQKLVTYAQRSYFRGLLEEGVEIFLYETAFLHAKHLRIDDKISIIGSCNIDQRSFELNAEISLIAYDSGTANALREVEQTYRSEGKPLDKEQWKARNILRKVLENCARMLSDLL